MRMKVNLDDVNTRDLIRWEALQALYQTVSDEDNRGHECESYTSKTDGKESADVKKLADGKQNMRGQIKEGSRWQVQVNEK